MPTIDAARRLAVATSADLPSIQPDDVPLPTALRLRGIELQVCVWNDPDVDWSSFDGVLIRTIWDYFKHHAAFLGWLDQLDRLGVPTINDSALLRWNSDKRYLLELAARGVAIIPTELADLQQLPQVVAAMPSGSLVVKPSVSGGAWHTLRGVAGDPVFENAMAQLPAGHDYLVQPFVEEVVSDGEWSLLYFDGTFSHAVLKRAAPGDYRVQGEFGGSVERIQPSPDTLEAAARALAAAATIGHGDHAYARVDGVIRAGQFLVMELEMIEPLLYLHAWPHAVERLAKAVDSRLARRTENPAQVSVTAVTP